MTEEKYWNLMSRYLSKELSLEETDEFLAWLDEDPKRSDMLKELQETWAKTRNYPDSFEVNTQAAWQRLRTNISDADRKERKPGSSFPFLAVAASMFLVLSIGFLAYNYLGKGRLIEVENVAGQRKEIVLPDGSEVWLNENSSLSYPESFASQEKRTVTLKGEAFFAVKKNAVKPFLIETGNTITQVLGTSFNVKEDSEGSIKVSVISGKVAFRSGQNPHQELILLPGDAGIISREGYAAKTKYENENFLYWKTGSLSFENIPLRNVVKSLEDAYHVRFMFEDPDLLNQRITTSFNHASFEQVMDVLEVMLDLKIKKTDSVYLIEKQQ